MRKNIIVLLAVMLAFVTVACDPQEAQTDSTREVVAAEQEVTDLPPAQIVEPESIEIYLNVDGFRNVARLCVDGNGIYVTSRGGVTVNSSGEVSTTDTGGSLPSSIAAIPNDPGCAR